MEHKRGKNPLRLEA